MNEIDFVKHFLLHPEQQWSEFAERYGTLLEKLVYFFGFRGPQAEDALQDVFYELLRSDLARLKKWDPEKGSFRVFLKVVVSRILVDLLRGKKFRTIPGSQENLDCDRDQGLASPIAAACNPRGVAEEEEMLRVLDDEIEGLIRSRRAKQVDAIILKCRYFEFPDSVTSRLTGLSENAVSSRFFRLRKVLQKRLKAKGIVIS